MKVLIIGLGSIARKHITAIREIDPHAEILALRSTRNGGESGLVQDIYSVGDVPGDLDFILISNPTSLHAAAIRSVLPLRKPLFIEKPLMDHAGEGQELSRLIEEYGIVTYIGCNLRFHPLIVHLKEFVRNKRINEVNVYCGSYLPNWRQGVDYRNIYSVDPQKGGGVHLDLIHELDYICWLFGKPAEIRATFRNVSSLGIASYDYANYCLGYEGFSASIQLNYYRRDTKRQIELVSDQTSWLGNLLQFELTDLMTGEKIFSSDESIMDTYRAQMRYFIDCIKNGTRPMNDFDEALNILKLSLHEV